MIADSQAHNHSHNRDAQQPRVSPKVHERRSNHDGSEAQDGSFQEPGTEATKHDGEEAEEAGSEGEEAGGNGACTGPDEVGADGFEEMTN